LLRWFAHVTEETVVKRVDCVIFSVVKLRREIGVTC